MLTHRDILAYYPFEASPEDDALGSITLTLTDTTQAKGKFGKGLSFNGSTSVANAGQPAALNLSPTAEWSISAWFQTSGDGTIVAKAGGATNVRQYQVYVQTNALFVNVGGVFTSLTTGVANGAWHHVWAYNYSDSGTWKHGAFLDGVQLGTEGNSGTATQESDVLLGARRNTAPNTGLAFQLTGRIDDVAFWSAKPSASDVRRVMRGLNRVSLRNRFRHGVIDRRIQVDVI